MPGPYSKGLFMPFAINHTGGGTTQNHVILTMPSRMAGRVVITSGTGTTGMFYSAQMHWDGTTLTLSEIISQHAGTLSGSSIRVDSGNLEFRFAATNSYATSGHFDFDGVFYVHS
jgi:hypothetical protein